MNVFELVLAYGFNPKKKSNINGGEYSTPCPGCGGDDRFILHPEKNNGDGAYFCRGCGKYGDNVQFYRDFHNLSFKEAWKKAGRGEYFSKHKAELTNPKQKKNNWQPTTYKPPAELWQEKASKFLEICQSEILNQPGVLKWLENRGLPYDAVVKYGLGWNPGERGGDLFRNRESWGLDRILKEETGRPKALWLPIGLVIPCFLDHKITRLRIRRTKKAMEKNPVKYYFVPGSSPGPMVFGENNDVFVIVEAELDAMLIDFHASHLAGAISVGSLASKPDKKTTDILNKAIHIMNALDFEETKLASSGGIKAIRWWKKNFKHCDRWPVPVGKDPGEAYGKKINIAEWIKAGLPPIKTLEYRKANNNEDDLSHSLNDELTQLFKILSETGLAIEYHETPTEDGKTETTKGILEPYPCWITDNWDLYGQLESLLFYDQGVSDYLLSHPAKIITAQNFSYQR